ncbi:HipA N-terminal domain-containing protein [Bacteroides sp.]
MIQREAEVLLRGKRVGVLQELTPKEYVFRYDDSYLAEPNARAIALNMPVTQAEYRSKYLFPFFFNMLSEGKNKQSQSRQLHISESDYFGLLLATAQVDTAGAVTIKPI